MFLKKRKSLLGFGVQIYTMQKESDDFRLGAISGKRNDFTSLTRTVKDIAPLLEQHLIIELIFKLIAQRHVSINYSSGEVSICHHEFQY